MTPPVLGLDFAAPDRLWLLAGAGALVVAYAVTQVRRRADAARFADPALLPLLVAGRAPWWRHVVAVAFAAALALATVAAAEPTVPASTARDHATVMLAIDTSDSMKATDVAPSRLAAAVSVAKALIADLPATYSVGVVSADASPDVVVAPSTDHAAVAVALDRLVPSPGTALGDAIFTALAALPVGATTAPPATAARGSPEKEPAARPAPEQEPAARIVVLSDGKSTTGRPDAEAIAAAREARVPVSTIAFGTGNASVESAGRTVPVPVDASALEAIALGTGGKFLTATSAAELRSVYAGIKAEVKRSAVEEGVAEWFAAGALVLLLLGSVVSMLRTGRVVWT